MLYQVTPIIADIWTNVLFYQRTYKAMRVLMPADGMLWTFDVGKVLERLPGEAEQVN